MPISATGSNHVSDSRSGESAIGNRHPDPAVRKRQTIERTFMGGSLRNGNTPGDLLSSPRCGARTRSGSACRAPAVQGRRRCRLHGGLSTGPKTAAGLGRVRAARTKHGRYSAEHLAFRRMVRNYVRGGLHSAMTFPLEMRTHVRARALAPIPRWVLQWMRSTVHAELAEREQRHCQKWAK